MSEMKLIPFTISSLESDMNELPYGVAMHQAPFFWGMGEKGENVVIAVIDTGAEKKHPFIKSNIIGYKNYVNEEAAEDLNGHGTHVAGIIRSIAPKCKLLIIKVLDKDGSGNYSDIVKAINFAGNWEGENGEKVRIINMSLGGSEDSKALEKSILRVCSKGILVVVASGNEGDNNENTYEYGYPALYNECITVAACDENKNLAGFSNNHLQVDITAAGVRVLSSYLNGGYARLSGTSMATPHISGILALLIPYFEKAFKRTLTESELYSLLVKCCCTLGYQKSGEGNGLPQLEQAIKHC